MWRKEKADTAAIQVQIEEAKRSQAYAENALLEQKRQRPRVESLVSYLQERREQNGFGEDFTIALTPRI